MSNEIDEVIRFLTDEERRRYVTLTDDGMLMFGLTLFAQEQLGLEAFMRAEKKTRNSGFLYLLECQGHYKIGVSQNVKNRVHDIEKSIPFDISVVGHAWLDNAYKAESYWHKHYARHRIRGEWFLLPSQNLLDIAMFMQSEGGFVRLDLLTSCACQDINEADMINRIVLGMPAKEFREAQGVESVRDALDAAQLSELNRLQIINTGLIEIGMDYQERKEKLIACHQRGLIQLDLAT